MAEELEYARPDLPKRRYSKLAILSLLFTALSCPCISGSLLRWVRANLSLNLEGFDLIVFFFGMPVVAVVVGMLSAIRARKRKELLGLEMSVAAAGIAVIWLLVLAILMLALTRIQM